MSRSSRFCGAATAGKVYPVAVLPLALVYVPRACRLRGLVWYAAVLVLTHLPFLILGPPVLFCVLAAAVIRATRDLVLQAELRTLPNIVVAIAGLIGLVAAVWWWWGEYPSTIRPSRSP